MAPKKPTIKRTESTQHYARSKVRRVTITRRNGNQTTSTTTWTRIRR